LFCLLAGPAGAQHKTDQFGDPLPREALARIGTIRFKHSGQVDSLAWSADGKRIVAGDESGAVLVWDAATGRRVRTLRGHSSGVDVVGFSGKRIVSSSADETVRIWESGSDRARVLQNQGPSCLAVSPDGKRLAVSRGLLDLGSGKLRHHGGMRGAVSVAFSFDGKLLALGGKQTGSRLSALRVSVRKAPDWREVRSFEGTSAAFSPDGKQLACWDPDAGIGVRCWDLTTGAEIRHLLRDRFVVTAAYSPDGSLLATSVGETVRLWSVATGKQAAVLNGMRGPVTALVFSPDGKRIATGNIYGRVRVWKASSGQSLNAPEPHPDGAATITYGPGGLLASGGFGGRIRVWKGLTASRSLTVIPAMISALAFSPSGDQLASALRRRSRVQLWDLATGSPTTLLSGSRRMVRGLHYDKHGRRILAVNWDVGGFSWSRVADGREQSEVRLPGNHAFPVSRLRADGSVVLAGVTEHGVYVWTRRTGLRQIRYPGSDIQLAISPDGRLLALASPGVALFVVDARSGATLRILDPADRAAFSPDGRLLASGRNDGLLLIHALDSGRVVHRAWTDPGSPQALAWAPDSKATGRDQRPGYGDATRRARGAGRVAEDCG